MRIGHSSSIVKILAVLLILAATWSLLAVKGNFVRSCSVEPQTIDVAVGSSFSVQIWLRNLDPGYMTSFYFTISWDPSMLGFISRTLTLVQDWYSTSETIQSDYYVLHASGPLYNPDASWVTLTFRCLGAGTTQILPGTAVIYVDSIGQGCATLPATIDQRLAPATPYNYVGGESFTANKLAVLSPYLALFSIVAVVVVVVKRKLT